MATPIVIEEEEDEDSADLSERIPNYLDRSTSSALVFKAKASLLSQTSPKDSLVGFVDTFESPVTVVEDQDCQRGMLEVEAEVDSAISILHGAINKHFAMKAELRTEEELFLLPEDMENFSLKQKTKLIHDLCEQVSYELLSGHSASVWSDFVSPRKSDASFPMRKRDDVVRRIFRLPPAGLHMSGAEVRQLAELLIGASRSSAVQTMQQELRDMQETVLASATQLSDLRSAVSKRTEELETVTSEKAKAVLEVVTLKSQLLYLEQQLEDTLVQAYHAEELAKTLQADLRFLTQEIATNSDCKSRLITTDLALYLAGKSELGQGHSSRTSVQQRSQMRVSFNLTEEAKSRGSLLNRQSGKSLSAIIKKKTATDLPKSPDSSKPSKK